jgi:hypothetical protein
MSCFNSNCYLPQPPRAWSRVQNSCSLITDTDNNGLVRDPYTGQLVPAVVLAERISMLNKGNVLQYKANSSNLTKAQKYSKIAKGQWVNRNTTWATQSTRGYTNPNTTSLKRSGDVINISIDPITGAIIGPTIEPPTCPQPVITDNEGLPSNGGGGSDVKEPYIPPPVEPSPGSNVFPDIIPDTPVEPIVIQDGGNLICSVQENICTGETKSTVAQQLCHPTTDSDVPGKIQELCWNDGTQTWYPRQRYVMTNSANKWPVNAELFSSIIINTPVITSITSDRNVITLTWSFDSSCLPATNFNIYQDGILFKVVDGNIFTTTIIVNNCNTYEYYIVSENTRTKSISNKSNIVDINVAYPESPTNLTKGNIILTSISNSTSGQATIELLWDAPLINCVIFNNYNIFMSVDNGMSYINIGSSFTTSFTTLSQNINQTYLFYVTTTDINLNQSEPSNIVNVSLPIIYTTTGTVIESFPLANYVMLKYTTNGNIIFNYNLNMSFTLVSGGGAGAAGFFTTPTAAGGGGEVRNSNGFWIVNSDTWSINIGIGQAAFNELLPPSLGTPNDTSLISTTYNITNSQTVKTNSANYAGKGGNAFVNYSDNGGGGQGSTGGAYITTPPPRSGGGAGGSLVTISQDGTTVVTSGNTGSSGTLSTGGNGGNGQLGIDGLFYGGGGGGAQDAGDITTIGIGGNGGGGNGGYFDGVIQINGMNGIQNSGGGGGGTVSFQNIATITAGNGGSGIAILYFTVPP